MKMFVPRLGTNICYEEGKTYLSSREILPHRDGEIASSLGKGKKGIFFRICLNFTANKFDVILFCLFEALFGIFTLFALANRPLFAAFKQCKSTQNNLSTKLEIKSKQILTFVR